MEITSDIGHFFFLNMNSFLSAVCALKPPFVPIMEKKKKQQLANTKANKEN